MDWTRVEPVDVLCAGFPCQPVSAAGRQQGDADQRWLWPHVRACYQALRPQEIVLENVRNLVSIRGGSLFAGICQDLRDDGYAVRWATAGACAVGAPHHRHRVFMIARYAWQLDVAPAERVDLLECGARKNRGRLLLPTPTKSDGSGGPRGHRDGGPNLRTAIADLADGAEGGDGALLPTPTARDWRTGYDHDRGASRALMLNDIAQQDLLPTLSDVTHDVAAQAPLAGPLLPTPRHCDAAKGGPNQHGSRGDLMLPSAVIGDRYGRYAPAVALWEHLTAVPAPDPTIRTDKGLWRLNPQLSEWMMGYPAGWITDILGRAASLRCAGNGVVHQVVPAVYPLVTAGWPYLRGGQTCSDLSGPARPGPGGGALPAPRDRPGVRRRAVEQLTVC